MVLGPILGGGLGVSVAILGLLRAILEVSEATFGVQRGMHWGWQAAWGGLSGHPGGHLAGFRGHVGVKRAVWSQGCRPDAGDLQKC